MSTRRKVGLVGVSIQISFVCGRTGLLAGALCCARSTKVISRFAQRRRTRSKSRNVPPYRSSIATMWPPAVDQLEQRAGCRHARRERETVRAAFEIGDAPLPRIARGVGECARSRSPCAHRGSTARTSRWRRSAASPRRSRDRAPDRRGCSGWRNFEYDVAWMDHGVWILRPAGAGSSTRPSA